MDYVEYTSSGETKSSIALKSMKIIVRIELSTYL
jgi:hypothetical protein